MSTPWYCHLVPWAWGCQINMSGASGGWTHYPPDVWIVSNGTPTELTGDILANFKKAEANVKSQLSGSEAEQQRKLESFYREQGALQYAMIAEADALKAEGHSEQEIAFKIASEGFQLGMYDFALAVYKNLPTQLNMTIPDHVSLFGLTLQNQGRVLDAMGKPDEAEAVFANARHVQTLNGMVK